MQGGMFGSIFVILIQGVGSPSSVGALSLVRSAAVHKTSSQLANATVCWPKYWRCARPHRRKDSCTSQNNKVFPHSSSTFLQILPPSLPFLNFPSPRKDFQPILPAETLCFCVTYGRLKKRFDIYRTNIHNRYTGGYILCSGRRSVKEDILDI